MPLHAVSCHSLPGVWDIDCPILTTTTAFNAQGDSSPFSTGESARTQIAIASPGLPRAYTDCCSAVCLLCGLKQ